MVSVNRQNPYYCLLWGVRQAPIDGKNVFSIEFLKIVSSLNGSEVFKVLGNGAASPRKLLKGRQWVFAFSYECHHHWSGLITQSEVSQARQQDYKRARCCFPAFFRAWLSAPHQKLRVKQGYPSDTESCWAAAGIWAGSSQLLVLSSAAALPLVLFREKLWG